METETGVMAVPTLAGPVPKTNLLGNPEQRCPFVLSVAKSKDALSHRKTKTELKPERNKHSLVLSSRPWRRLMRTHIEIDDDLMAQALKVGGFKTRKAAVEEGLRLLVQTKAQRRLRGLRGRLRWEGSLEDMRRDR